MPPPQANTALVISAGTVPCGWGTVVQPSRPTEIAQIVIAFVMENLSYQSRHRRASLETEQERAFELLTLSLSEFERLDQMKTSRL
jgi:hypothetical protein